jgi:hypothetical protein
MFYKTIMQELLGNHTKESSHTVIKNRKGKYILFKSFESTNYFELGEIRYYMKNFKDKKRKNNKKVMT